MNTSILRLNFALSSVALALSLCVTPAWSTACRGVSNKIDKALALTDVDQESVKRWQAIDWSTADEKTVAPTASSAQDTARLLTAGLSLYRSLPPGPARRSLLQALTASRAPSVYSSGLLWATSSDSDRRLEGFEILGHYEPTELKQCLVLEAMRQEKTPAVLAEALRSLTRDNPSPSLFSFVMPRLHELTFHQNEQVQMLAIQPLAEWDRDNRYFPVDALRLMSHRSAQVKEAAIGAVSISRTTSPQIKQRLLQLLTNPREDPDVRFAAQLNLGHFQLNPTEHRAFVQAVAADLPSAK